MNDKQLTIEEKIERIENSESFEDLKTGWFPQSASTSYYFVSYCHKDYKKVFIDILGMQGVDSDVAVWYDRELSAGRDWEKEAKTHIYDFDCLGVIFYISENSVESTSIPKEMQMVLDAGKPFIPILLPVETMPDYEGEYLSGEKLLKILRPRLSKDDETYKLYHEMFGENITYLLNTSSPQDKIERMKKSFTRRPLLEISGYKNRVGTAGTIAAVNNINVIEVNESDYRFIDENNQPITVSEIGKCAFSNCKQLETVMLPKTIRIIGKFAFYNCKKLKTVKLSSDSGLEYINDSAFMHCRNLINIALPNGTRRIGNNAFSGCSCLTNISIPHSVKSIGEFAFFGCSGLTSFDIPDSVESVGKFAFSGCSGLTSISIADSVKSIGELAFSGCSGLTSIDIPDSVESIGFFAFGDCSGLTSISIPHSVKSIGRGTFNNCSSLTSIVFDGSMDEWKNIYTSDEGAFIPIKENAQEREHDNRLKITQEVTVTCTDGSIKLNKITH